MFGVKSIKILANGKQKVKLRWWVYVLIGIPWAAFGFWMGMP